MKTTKFEKGVIKFVENNMMAVSLVIGIMFLTTFVSLWIWGYEASSGVKLIPDLVAHVFGAVMWFTVSSVLVLVLYLAARAADLCLIEDEMEVELEKSKEILKHQDMSKYSDEEIIAYARLSTAVKGMLDNGEGVIVDYGLKSLLDDDNSSVSD